MVDGLLKLFVNTWFSSHSLSWSVYNIIVIIVVVFHGGTLIDLNSLFFYDRTLDTECGC